MTTPATSNDMPRRFVWTKRWAVCIATLIIVVVVVTRGWWGYVASIRLTAAIEEVHARGEPILVTDFATPRIPDEQNAAFFINRACAAIYPNAQGPSSSSKSFPDYLPYRPIWHQMADRAYAANPTALADARRARQAPGVDWGTRYATPFVTVFPRTYLNMGHQLGLLLADVSLRAHFRGEDREALEYVADIRSLSRTVHSTPLLVDHLLATGIDGLACARIETIAGGLTVEGVTRAATTVPSARPATRRQVTDLIASLLDDAPYDRDVTRAHHGQRMLEVDTILWAASRSVVLRPMYEFDAARVARGRSNFADAVGSATWPDAMKVMGPRPSVRTFAPTRLLSYSLATGQHRSVEIAFRNRAERRFAALALATRLFSLDYGRFPTRLDELVPAYLPSLPVDPFSPTGEPFGYVLAMTGTRPVAYSVAEDGVDDTVDETGLGPDVCRGWPSMTGNTLAKDQQRDLSRWQPATPPSDYMPTNEDGSPETLPDE
jgi:hypothetical protein